MGEVVRRYVHVLLRSQVVSLSSPLPPLQGASETYLRIDDFRARTRPPVLLDPFLDALHHPGREVSADDVQVRLRRGGERLVEVERDDAGAARVFENDELRAPIRAVQCTLPDEVQREGTGEGLARLVLLRDVGALPVHGVSGVVG